MHCSFGRGRLYRMSHCEICSLEKLLVENVTHFATVIQIVSQLTFSAVLPYLKLNQRRYCHLFSRSTRRTFFFYHYSFIHLLHVKNHFLYWMPIMRGTEYSKRNQHFFFVYESAFFPTAIHRRKCFTRQIMTKSDKHVLCSIGMRHSTCICKKKEVLLWAVLAIEFLPILLPERFFSLKPHRIGEKGF